MRARSLRITPAAIQSRMQSAPKTQIPLETLTRRYESVPTEMDLKSVVVIHRHGDRSQISRSLGTRYPESEVLAAIWDKLLPTERSCKAMILAAQPGGAVTKDGGAITIDETLYGGWDRVNRPYGQLTDLGSQQLVSVGKLLQERYSTLLTGTAKDDIYCRSTNTCRTGQSIRSLLVGLLDINPDEHDNHIKASSLQNLPHIHVRPYALENLYPQGGGPAMIHRRSQVYPPGLEERTLPGYKEDVARAQELFQFAEKVNWVVAMEVLNCHSVHNIEHIKGATPEDLETATRLATWHWSLLYKVRTCTVVYSFFHFSVGLLLNNSSTMSHRQDPQLNRLAIGRFLWDMKCNLEASLGIALTKPTTIQRNSCFRMLGCGGSDIDIATDTFRTEQAAATGKRVLIYSGHDSTLVPVLCALGIFDGKVACFTFGKLTLYSVLETCV